MKKKKQKNLAKKTLTIVLIIIMITNLVLLASWKIDPLFFWIIIAVCAIIAFKIFPIKRNKRKKGKIKHRR